MRNYKTIKGFTTAVKNAVAKELPECSVEAVNITKNNNVKLHGISIRPQESAVAPTVYTAHYFAAHQSGKPFDAVVKDFIKDCKAALKSAELGIDPNFISSFAAVKDKICYKLVNGGLNKNLLDSVPHRDFHGLAVMYYLQLGTSDSGTSTVDITNSLAQIWNVDEPQLYELAQANTPRLHRGIVLSISDAIRGLTVAEVVRECGTDEYDGFDVSKSGPDILPMYVATNTDKIFGAVTVLYDGLLDAVAAKLGCDGVFVLPSSVHDMLIIPDTSGNVRKFTDMVREINAHEVLADEVLSDDIYHYSVENREFKTVS